MTDLIQDLQWRYATKKYTSQTVSEKLVAQIVEAVNLSASSCGLQPYRLFVISNPEVKKQLAEGSFNSQIGESSHLLVFAGMNRITTGYITEYVSMMERQREMEPGALSEFADNLISFFSTQTAEQNAIWSSKQAYIGLGTALIAAAALKVDSTPMEGFDANVFDKVLGLTDKGLHCSVILSLGYRDQANDFLASLKKTRLPITEFSTEIK
ncbi:nitroreductase [Flavobacterium akiainvivens]|uniref:Nitroreductase n=1 Tax=Flavobacterium akiainvivens TaxID=1202724 RepID=A0A0M9VHM8_9FLAO|nr:nitroreductase family protein [Flavobacterium akiainvivens]KOS05746.1 nitroreductase [Flavobacterium akiainvivens]SFQ37783.1 Nitroreductase [Flavobacterium akiainvivens]